MLQNWLSPISLSTSKLKGENVRKQEFGNKIQTFEKRFPKLKNTQIAIIGIGDEQANQVREELYKLSFPFKKLKIADIGNVRNEQISFLIPIITELLDSGIFPILIGNKENGTLAQFKAHKNRQQLVNLAIVDEQVRCDPDEKPTSEFYFLNDLLRVKHPSLFHLDIIACQSHFISGPSRILPGTTHFDFARLGNVRNNIESIEPLARDADLMSFSLSALKQSEAPGQADASPSGLFSEEACQICRYAGISDKLSSMGIYGYDPTKDTNRQTAKVIAQMVWYFVDGFVNRKDDYPISSDGLTEYIVDMKSMQQNLTFWKSEKSGRWWIQVPVKTKKKHQRHRLIPCSYRDYKMTCQDEIPERLLVAFKRFM
ncbi:MAG: formiminoglutamase [Polaribacter sp.]|jgi:formiminoglutamase